MQIFYDSVDFKKNDLYNLKLKTDSVFPLNSKRGLIHYYTGSGFDGEGLYYYDGTNQIKTGPIGPIYINQRNHIEVTFSELMNDHQGYLEPGLIYNITDFKTSYEIGGNWVLGDVESILLTAIDTDKFAPIGQSRTHKNDIITQIEPDVNHPMGRIIYRKDTLQNIESYYDQRSVKFRRWNRNTENIGEYTSQDSNTNPYEDYYTFIDKYATNFYNISIGKITEPNILENNIVFLVESNNVIIGDNSYNSTLKGIFDCKIGNGFKYNNISNDFKDNIISNNFQSNDTGINFEKNVILDNCENNNFGKDFINNTLGKNFKYNQFDYDTQNNKFGDNCIDNVFGKGFKNNEIADYFYNNTFSLNSMNNKFLLDNISNVNFGTKVARRLDIGYSDIEVIKTITLGVLDLALEQWAGVIYISTSDAIIENISFTNYSHPIEIIPITGINITLKGTPVVNGLNGDILMPTNQTTLKGNTGDRIVLKKDALGRFRQVTGIDFI